MNKEGYGPILPSYEYMPDPEPHIFENRLYMYGSHDRFGGNKFCLGDYICYSAPLDDLTSWRYEGEIYRRTQDPSNTKGKMTLYAPDVAQGPDGRYYLYYCLSQGSNIGVAVCDSPAGSYEFLGYVKDTQGTPIGERAGDTIPFDPAILVDDRIWLYSGNGPRAQGHDKKKKKASVCMELAKDMMTIKAEPVHVLPTLHNGANTGFEGHEFFEASSIRKYNGRYYLIYSSVQFHELCYAISHRPDGGFTYGGVLISNGDIRPESQLKIGFNAKANRHIKNYIGNNHGSLVEINGKYYILYHRQTNRNMYSRQVCAAEIEMTPEGTFLQAQMTSNGFHGPLGSGKYEARIACQLYSKEGGVFSAHPLVQNKKHPAFTQDGMDRDMVALFEVGLQATKSNQHISNMRDGATAVFKYFDLLSPNEITVTVRGKGTGYMAVRTGIDEEPAAKIPISPSKEWASYTGPFHGKDEITALYFTYEGKKAIDFLDFTLPAAEAPQ